MTSMLVKIRLQGLLQKKLIKILKLINLILFQIFLIIKIQVFNLNTKFLLILLNLNISNKMKIILNCINY
jgi:hypothetical protein